ncbi:MAG: PHP domain-containing protein [Planctomycetota bacterium]
MIDYDLHIHTEYCGHAPGMTVAAILQRAEELGLSAIAITDHIFKQADHAIIQKIRDDAAAYGPTLKVFIGAEVDVNPADADGRLVTDDLDGLDIVIAGFHYVPTVGNLPHGPQDNTLSDEVFMEVWASSLLGIVSNPKIHTLAHPGRLLAASVDLDVHFEDALCVFEKAAALSAKNAIAWELNELSGYRLAPYWLDQWHRIYEIALAAGVKLVYGSDAHTPDSIGLHDKVDILLAKLPDDCLAWPEEIIQL